MTFKKKPVTPSPFELLDPVTTDIDIDTRSGTWDVGADEYVGAAAGGITHRIMVVT